LFERIYKFDSAHDTPMFTAGYRYETGVWAVLTRDANPDDRMLCIGKTGRFKPFKSLTHFCQRIMTAIGRPMRTQLATVCASHVWPQLLSVHRVWRESMKKPILVSQIFLCDF